jgi:hypothetical protein
VKGTTLNVSVRSYLTAGVAAVGASAIALTPLVTPTLPEVHIPSAHAVAADVALAAVPNPIERWGEVFEATKFNIEDLFAMVAAAPAPVAEQLIKNTLANVDVLVNGLSDSAQQIITALGTIPSALQNAVAALSAGDIEGAVTTLLDPLLGAGFGALLSLAPVFEISTEVVNRAAEVINTIFSAETVLRASIAIGGLLLSPINALAHTAQEIFNGFDGGDFTSAVYAVLNIPADLVNAFINGYGDITVDLGFGPLAIPAPGLLTGPSGPFGDLPAGLVAQLQYMRERISWALGAPSPWGRQAAAATVAPEDVPEGAGLDEVAKVPDLEKSTVTLVADSGAPAERSAPTLEVEKPDEETPAPSVDDTSLNDDDSVSQEPVKDLKAERKAKREAAKADREAARAERGAQREAAKAERGAQRDSARAERAAKRGGSGGASGSAADAA